MAYFVALEDLYTHAFIVNETYDNESAAYLRAKMLAADARQRAQAQSHKYHVHYGTSAPSLHAQDTSFNALVNDSRTISWRDGGGTLHVQDFGSEATGWYIRLEMLKAAQSQGQCSDVSSTGPHQAGNVSGYLGQ